VNGTLERQIQISDVSRLLGIPVPTIRSWERRYGFPTPGRTQGRHRRYSREEIELLRAVRDEITRGHPASEAVRIVTERGRHGASPRTEYLDQLVTGAMALDPEGVRRTLDAATDTLGAEAAICDVALPAMREIGARWSTGTCDVAHEHLATAAVDGWLGRLASTAPSPDRPPIVLACGPKDLHAIGLEAFGVLLARRGWTVRQLGALTPTTAIARAVVETRARGAVVTSQRGVTRRAAVESIEAVAALTDVAAFYAGDAFAAASARRDVPGTYLGTDLTEATRTVERTVGSGRPGIARPA
jgi:DNA-binding transcriptional MerR regulator